MAPGAHRAAVPPATVLALDTTTARGSAALLRGEGDVAVLGSDPGRGFGEQLPGLLVGVLEAQGLSFRDVDLFAVTAGPGSLTGLRVGIATVQGLALATGRPVVAVTTLDALVHSAVEAGTAGRQTIGACMDAFRGEVFTALYRMTDNGSGEVLSVIDPPGVGRPDDVSRRWRVLTEPHDLLVAGDSPPASVEWFERVLGAGLRFSPAPLLAGTVARLARARALLGAAVAPHAVHPVYLRRPDAEVARERGAVPPAGGANR